MKRTAFLLLAAVSAFLIAAPRAHSEEHPRYGGTLRVQLRDAIFSLDPGENKTDVKGNEDLTGASHRIAFLVFDRLTRIDDQGRVRPQLAVSWTSDAQHKNWRFNLRPGVTFHDGTPLTANNVIPVFANDARWQVRNGNGALVVVFECPNPIYDLPAVLAGARHSIVLHTAALPTPEDLVGTGPFRVAAWQPGRQLSLTANPDYYDGRPYVDGIEIQMGNSVREQLSELRLDRDDLVEVDTEQARRLTAASQRVVASSPARLLAILFRTDELRSNAPHENGARNPSAALRELLARSINREAIYAAILKKSGASANSLLPQWLTGYALLFESAPDPARIQKLRSDTAKTPPIYLAFDPSDPVNKAVADRIAVNARDVGITVQVFAEKNIANAAQGRTSRADAILITLPIGSAHAGQALDQLAESAHLEQMDVLAANSPEQLFAAEQSLLESYQLVPVAHLPATFWTSTRVRNWKMSPDGRWNLEQVWLDSVK